MQLNDYDMVYDAQFWSHKAKVKTDDRAERVVVSQPQYYLVRNRHWVCFRVETTLHWTSPPQEMMLHHALLLLAASAAVHCDYISREDIISKYDVTVCCDVTLGEDMLLFR